MALWHSSKPAMIELKEQEKKFDADEWRIVSEEVIRREISKYDIILFNQGQHHESRILISKSPVYFTNIGQMLHGKNEKNPLFKVCTLHWSMKYDVVNIFEIFISLQYNF